MVNDIFDEVEHWLAFIKIWEKENKEKVPNEVIITLEVAFEKAISNYKNSTLNENTDKYSH